MKFKIYYQVGKNIRTKNIVASNLEEAEEIANKKFKKWIDIVMVDKTKGKICY